MRLLIVEDERTLAETLAKGLRRQGIAVDLAFDGRSGLDLAVAADYDVVVIDRNLPVMSGDDVCRSLAGGASRLLILTASGTITDRVEGLNLGADDYLAKPFSFDELVARIHALARRVLPAALPVLAVSDITLDVARHSASRAGRALDLTRKEFAVLHLLLAARGAVVSMDTLVGRVWDMRTNADTNAARIVVSHLRQKLGRPTVIQTVPGVGYRI
jgi:DNA-binding response OmpR family regulator